MISESFLQMLQCPQTRTPLRIADASLVEALRARVRDGSIRQFDGSAPLKDLADRLDGALVNADGSLAYVISGGIPNLIREEALTLTTSD